MEKNIPLNLILPTEIDLMKHPVVAVIFFVFSFIFAVSPFVLSSKGLGIISKSDEISSQVISSNLPWHITASLICLAIGTYIAIALVRKKEKH